MSYESRSSQKNSRPRRAKFALFGILLIALTVSIALISGQLNSKNPAGSKSLANQSTPASNIEGSYLYSGTIVLARDVEKYANGNYAEPFSGMSTLGNYDAHIGILECPFTDNADSYANEVNNLIFNCDPAWIPDLKQYFPILNLSSDHLNDQGPAGIAETFQLLKAAGIQTVGTYDPSSLSDDCSAAILPVRIVSTHKSSLGSLPIAMCSYNYKEIFQPQPGQLSSIANWTKTMPVVALLNEGPEYQHQLVLRR